MIVEELKPVETKVIVDVLCTICGNSCNTDYGLEYMNLSTNWGFLSNKDLESWKAQICEKCVDNYLVPIINFDITTSGLGPDAPERITKRYLENKVKAKQEQADTLLAMVSNAINIGLKKSGAGAYSLAGEVIKELEEKYILIPKPTKS